MLANLAKRISSFFVSKNMVKEEEREIYDYCFEIMLSTLLNLCTIVILSVICDIFLETIFFVLGFMVVRSTAGGYHADTHWGCWMILMVSYMFYVFSMLVISDNCIWIVANTFAIVSLIVVIICSPVEDYKKPLTSLECKIFKRNSGMTVVVLAAIISLLTTQMDRVKWGYSIATAMLVVSLSLIAGTFKNRLRKSNY